MVRKEKKVRNAKNVRKLFVACLTWVAVIVMIMFTVGCSEVENHYVQQEKFENGVSVGFLVDSQSGVDTYFYEGFYYFVKNSNLVVNDVDFIYNENQCLKPYLMKGGIYENSLVNINEKAYISSDYYYTELDVYYKFIQGLCTPFYDLNGAWLSKVKLVDVPSFMDDGKVITD